MDFEKWFESRDDIGCLIGLEGYAAEEAWNARQAEIDALKACITNLVKQKNKANAKLDNIQEIIELKTSGSFTSVLRKIDAISEELLK